MTTSDDDGPVYVTDFGEVRLPELDADVLVLEVCDFRGPEGKKWKAYFQYVEDAAETYYRSGGTPYDLKVIPFSEWVKKRLQDV